MARWGRRGILYWLNQAGSYRRTRTVQWGSRSSAGRPPSAWTGLFGERKKRMKLGARRGLLPVAAPRSVSGKAPRPSAMKLGSRSRPFMAVGGIRPAAAEPSARARSAMNLGGGRRGGWGMRMAPRKSRRSTLLLIGLTVFVLAAIQSFIYIDRHLRIPMMNVAKVRMNQVATQAINSAISEQVAARAEFDKLIDWKTSGDGKISGFMLNYSEHMKITAETIDTVSETLYEMKHVKESIPIGHALGSAILSSFGPRIPVNFEPVGATQVELNTRQSSIGINNTLVEVYIKVQTEIAIIIPFDTEPQKLEAEIPVSYLLVVGDVPMYYYDNKGNPVGDSASSAPNIALPFSTDGKEGAGAQQEGGSAAPDAGSGGGSESAEGGIIAPPASEAPVPGAAGSGEGAPAGESGGNGGGR